MSSVTTTQITRVESTEELKNDSFEANLSSDSDSENFLEDTRYETAADETDICEDAIQKLKDLFLKNGLNKLEIIQRKNGNNKANQQLVSHVVFTNKKVDTFPTEDFKDQNSKYLFSSKSKLLKESELKLKQKNAKTKKKKKTIVSDIQINRIPKTFDEFLEIIFELKADPIFDEKSRLFFREETHNRDIRFQSHDSYVNSFIPFVIREFWNSLKTSAKEDLISYEMSYLKSEPTNEIILSHIRNKSSNKSVFKYGQLVLIDYSLIKESETEVQTYFGVIISVTSELIDKTSEHLSHPLLLSQTNSEENFIFEKLLVYCNPLTQSFETVSIRPLSCVQKHFLEARIIYELKEDRFKSVFQQILKPHFKFGITGFPLNLEQRKDLFDIQKDAIQKSYDVCLLPPNDDFSSFIAIYGGPKTGKTEILMETALQLLKSAEEKLKKLLVIAMGTKHLNDIIEALNKNEIKVFHIDSEGECLSHKNSDFKRIIKRMNKDNRFNDIVGKDESFQQCLKFYGQEIQSTDLTVKDKYVKENIDKRVIGKLLSESQVIIGSIASVMNNEEFNSIYNMNTENNIECVLIDEAHLLTETEFLTLLYSGVKSFVLFGDISKYAISFEKCESFLKRYVGLFTKNFQKTDSVNCSVLYLRETIASLQRLENNRGKSSNNHFNNRQNNGFGRKNPNQKIAEYRNHSNYGSEYFKRSDRFKDHKPFKTESKEGIKYNNGNHRFANPEPKNEKQQWLPGPSHSNSQGSHNPMINGITRQFSRGGHQSYMSRTPPQYNSEAFTSSPNRNEMSSANSDPNVSNYPSNITQFVSNPTRHQNYDLF